MGVVFALAALWILVVILIIGIVGYFLATIGIIGLIINKIFKKKGKKIKKFIPILSIIFNIVGILMTIPLNYIACVAVVSYLSPPDDYVETGLVIEENGRQYETFTVSNEVYESLPFIIYGWEYPEIGTPVFSYKTDGFWNKGKVGNYYSIENSSGYDIIWDGDSTLFCKQSEMDEVLNHYYTDSQWNSFCDSFTDYEVEVTDNKYIEVLEKLRDLNFEELEVEKNLDLSEVDNSWIQFQLTHNKDNDNFRLLYRESFKIYNGKLYYRKDYNSAYIIPDEIGSIIIEFYNENKEL